MIEKIDKDYKLPLYIQLKEIIEDKINRGIWKTGDKIPSEHELEKKYNVSRITVRQALKELRNEGKLNSERGRGTFVAKPKMEQPLPLLTSFTEDIKKQGKNPGSKLVNLEFRYPPFQISNKLNLDEEKEVIFLERIRTVDEEKVGIHKSYLNPKLIDEKHFFSYDFEQNSLYDILENQFNLNIGRAKESLEAFPADDYQSDLLGIKKGTPVLVLKRLTFTKDNKPLEYVEIIYRFDKYKYSIVLNR
jgi:GntR family transcriptional regulator